MSLFFLLWTSCDPGLPSDNLSDGDLDTDSEELESEMAEAESESGDSDPECEAACSPVCPPEAPHGCKIGKTLKDWVFNDCEGNSVSIHDLCGADALLVYVFYGWCNSCFDFLREASQLHDNYSSRGLEVVIISIENSLFEPVTEEYCLGLRETFTIPWTLTMDPEASFEDCGGGTGTAILLNESGRIVFKRDDATMLAIKTAIEKELDSP